MSDKLTSEKKLTFSVGDERDDDGLVNLGKALSSPERIKILRLLRNGSRYMMEIAEELDIPLSTVSRHIDILALAGLVFISFEPGPKGHSKLCSKVVVNVNITLLDIIDSPVPDSYTTEMPVGLYSDCSITAPCGMASKTAQLGEPDDPAMFFSAERVNAELLWFNTGSVSYKMPPPPVKSGLFNEIGISFEICSETLYYRDKWPSDITVSVNDVEITTFTSPGDFGGRRGKYSPEFWPITSTQFGILMKFAVNSSGVYVNNVLKNSEVTVESLNLKKYEYIKITLAIKDDAVHKGGLNIFGKSFGDYPQAIVMTLK